MSFHAANPARFSHLSLRPVEQANKTPSDAERGWRIAPFLRRTRLSNRAAIAANFLSQCADDNFALGRVCRYVSVFCSVTASGPFRRPAALGLLLRISRPFGVSVPPKTSLRSTAKNALKLLSGPSQKADLRHLGAGPTR